MIDFVLLNRGIVYKTKLNHVDWVKSYDWSHSDSLQEEEQENQWFNLCFFFLFKNDSAERSRRQEDECGADDLLQVGECIDSVTFSFFISISCAHLTEIKCVNQMGQLIQPRTTGFSQMIQSEETKRKRKK